MFPRIHELRIYEDYSMSEIARKVGVVKSTYSLYEYNINIIPLNRLIILSKVYNVSLDYLTSLSDSKKIIKNNFTLASRIIGKRIYEIRKRNNLTQQELAKILHIDQATYCNYENGKYLIKTSAIYSLAKHLNISLDQILGI